MHLHPALCFVVPHDMLDVRELEIAAQFAIDARKKILVKCRCNARRIVISGQQLRNRFLQVGSQQQRVAGNQNLAHFAKKLVSRGPVEISNRTAEEENQEMFALAPPCRYFLQAVQIRALESDDANSVHLTKFLPATVQRAA